MLRTYGSLTEFAAAAFAVVAEGKANPHSADEFTGYVSFIEALELARMGDDALAARAAALIETMSAEMPETRAVETVRGQYGRVDIGAYLAGSESPMRRRKRTRTVSAPLSLYVDIGATWKAPAAELEARGAAVLALVLRLERERPVDLYAYFATHGERRKLYYTVRLESRPVSVAHAAFALAHPGMLRQLAHALSRADGCSPGIPHGYGDREVFNCGPDDLMLPGIWPDNIGSDWPQWANDAMRQFSAGV